MSPVELAAVVFSLVAVWLTVKRMIWCWPTSIVAVILTVWVYFKATLYAEMALQAYYLLAAIWGWLQWSKVKNEQQSVPVRMVSFSKLLPAILLTVCLGLIMGFLFHRYSDNDTPYVDSLLASFSLLATALMVKRVLQNWIFWVFIDAASVFLYLYKELYGFAVLFLVYTVLAAKGWTDWKKIVQEEFSR